MYEYFDFLKELVQMVLVDGYWLLETTTNENGNTVLLKNKKQLQDGKTENEYVLINEHNYKSEISEASVKYYLTHQKQGNVIINAQLTTDGRIIYKNPNPKLPAKELINQAIQDFKSAKSVIFFETYPDCVRNNETVALLAVKNNPVNFRMCSEKLKNSADFVKKALSANPEVFKYLYGKHINTDIIWHYIKIGNNIYKIDRFVFEDKEMVFSLLKKAVKEENYRMFKKILSAMSDETLSNPNMGLSILKIASTSKELTYIMLRSLQVSTLEISNKGA